MSPASRPVLGDEVMMRTLLLHNDDFSVQELVVAADLFPSSHIGDLLEINGFVLKIGHIIPSQSSVNVQLSVKRQVAETLGLTMRQQVAVRRADRSAAAVDFIELWFKDQFISRSDMWRFVTALTDNIAYPGKEFSFVGMRATVKEMMRGQSVATTGLIYASTKFTFRSRSATFFILVQVSQEIWRFARDGFVVYEKMVNGLFKDIYDRWLAMGVTHRFSIVLFARFRHPDRPDLPPRDEYKIVVDRERPGNIPDLRIILRTELLRFMTLPRLLQGVERDYVLSYAHEGNLLECLNLALDSFDVHYVDRDLSHTGQAVIVLTGGQGLYDVDRYLAHITDQRMSELGIAVDVISTSARPLHAVPLFRSRPTGHSVGPIASVRSHTDAADPSVVAERTPEVPSCARPAATVDTVGSSVAFQIPRFIQMMFYENGGFPLEDVTVIPRFEYHFPPERWARILPVSIPSSRSRSRCSLPFRESMDGFGAGNMSGAASPISDLAGGLSDADLAAETAAPASSSSSSTTTQPIDFRQTRSAFSGDGVLLAQAYAGGAGRQRYADYDIDRISSEHVHVYGGHRGSVFDDIVLRPSSLETRNLTSFAGQRGARRVEARDTDASSATAGAVTAAAVLASTGEGGGHVSSVREATVDREELLQRWGPPEASHARPFMVGSADQHSPGLFWAPPGGMASSLDNRDYGHPVHVRFDASQQTMNAHHLAAVQPIGSVDSETAGGVRLRTSRMSVSEARRLSHMLASSALFETESVFDPFKPSHSTPRPGITPALSHSLAGSVVAGGGGSVGFVAGAAMADALPGHSGVASSGRSVTSAAIGREMDETSSAARRRRSSQMHADSLSRSAAAATAAAAPLPFPVAEISGAGLAALATSGVSSGARPPLHAGKPAAFQAAVPVDRGTAEPRAVERADNHELDPGDTVFSGGQMPSVARSASNTPSVISDSSSVFGVFSTASRAETATATAKAAAAAAAVVADGEDTEESAGRRWFHLYPDRSRAIGVLKWKSLTEPAIMPLTTDVFPEAKELEMMRFYNYTMTLSGVYSDKPELCMRELVCQRLHQGYQVVIDGAAAVVAADADPSDLTAAGDTVQAAGDSTSTSSATASASKTSQAAAGPPKSKTALLPPTGTSRHVPRAVGVAQPVTMGLRSRFSGARPAAALGPAGPVNSSAPASALSSAASSASSSASFPPVAPRVAQKYRLLKGGQYHILEYDPYNEVIAVKMFRRDDALPLFHHQQQQHQHQQHQQQQQQTMQHQFHAQQPSLHGQHLLRHHAAQGLHPPAMGAGASVAPNAAAYLKLPSVGTLSAGGFGPDAATAAGGSSLHGGDHGAGGAMTRDHAVRSMLLWSDLSQRFERKHTAWRGSGDATHDFKWNYMDSLVLGFESSLLEHTKFRRIRLALIPTETKFPVVFPSASFSSAGASSASVYSFSSSSGGMLRPGRVAGISQTPVSNLSSGLPTSFASFSTGPFSTDVSPVSAVSPSSGLSAIVADADVRARKRFENFCKFIEGASTRNVHLSSESSKPVVSMEESWLAFLQNASATATSSGSNGSNPGTELPLSTGDVLDKTRFAVLSSPKLDSAGCVTLETESFKSSRYEWISLFFTNRFNPDCFAQLRVEWLVCTGTVVEDLVQGFSRRAKQCGFQLVAIPYSLFETHMLDQSFVLPNKQLRFQSEEHLVLALQVLLSDAFRFVPSQVPLRVGSTVCLHETGCCLIWIESSTALRWIPNMLLQGQPREAEAELRRRFVRFLNKVLFMRSLIGDVVEQSVAQSISAEKPPAEQPRQ